MALDILYEFNDTEEIAIPNYIQEGLDWLKNKLYPNEKGVGDE